MTELNNPIVSVVIPTYNRADIVARAIKSVACQTFAGWELLVVDDGSADDTEKVVASFGDQRIRYLRHERNRGQSSAQNTGIRSSRGAYVAFLDSDDEWMPEKLAKVVACFEESAQDVGLVYSGKKLVTEGGQTLKLRSPTLQGDVYKNLLEWDFIGSCSRVVVRRSILEQVGGFDEQLVNCQDWDLWIRVSKVSRVAAVPDCLVIRYFGTDQVTGSLRGICRGKANMIEKYRDQMSSSVLGKQLATLAILLFNYDPASARRTAFQALKLRPLQPALLMALAASFLGRRVYGWLFQGYTGHFHGLYIGRARV
ncbi:MAG: glycosyltransferase [Terriglobia bacterium]|jgi:glycosyltransferase involved in cell wall biosynthesis